MKVLLIGGTGNISTECVDVLRRRGHEIAMVTRGIRAVPPACRSIVADRRNRAAMREALRDISADVVINFLGYDTAELEIDVDVFGSRIAQYVFISSTVVYAKPHQRLPLTEDGPLGNPFSDYAAKKLACEKWLQAQYDDKRFPVTIVRPSHTYSRRWIPNPVASSGYTVAARMEQGRPVFVHDDGQGLWTLTAASDFAVGLAGLLGREAAIGETYHITSDEVLTWNQIYAEIARALGVDTPEIVSIPTAFICSVRPEMTAKLRGDKAEPGVFDNAKIKRVVPDFACAKSFRNGIREAVEWFRSHPSEKKPDPAVDAVFDDVMAAWRKR